MTNSPSVASVLGEKIRELRRRAGLTQEQLAEGVCSAVSVSRIERGQQMPTQVVLDGLLAKVGAASYELMGVVDEDASGFDEKIERLQHLADAGCTDEALAGIAELKASARPQTEHMQRVLCAQALCVPDAQAAFELFDQALRQTKPRLDYEDFRHELLSSSEAECLVLAAQALCETGQGRRAIRILEELARALRAQRTRLAYRRLLLISVALNLVTYLCDEHRDEEAWEWCLYAERLSLAEVDNAFLPAILFNKAKLLHRLRHDDAAALSILRALVPYAELTGATAIAQVGRAWLQDVFGEKLQQPVPCALEESGWHWARSGLGADKVSG